MKYLFYVTLIFTTFLLSAFALTSTTLVGKWKGESEGEIGMITFDKAGYVSFTSQGKEVGGKKYKMEGMVFNMTYETNESVTPHTIDFVFTLASENLEAGRMTGIYKLVNTDTLIINMNFEGTERPTQFDPEDPNQITLHRLK